MDKEENSIIKLYQLYKQSSYGQNKTGRDISHDLDNYLTRTVGPLYLQENGNSGPELMEIVILVDSINVDGCKLRLIPMDPEIEMWSESWATNPYYPNDRYPLDEKKGIDYDIDYDPKTGGVRFKYYNFSQLPITETHLFFKGPCSDCCSPTFQKAHSLSRIYNQTETVYENEIPESTDIVFPNLGDKSLKRTDPVDLILETEGRPVIRIASFCRTGFGPNRMTCDNDKLKYHGLLKILDRCERC